MADVKIQKATMENLKDIQNLNLELFKKEYEEYDKTLDCNWTFSDKGGKYFKDMINNNKNIALVVLDESKIIGYLVGSIIRASKIRLIKKMAVLDNMFILEDYRNKGIGAKLVNEFINWCKSNKIKRVRVVSSAGNINAINFYKKNQFFEWEITLEANL